jgi:hypothetical protein
MTISKEARGRIVRTWNDGGLPILWTYGPDMPAADARRALPWLTIVRWRYDGSENNGMPHTEENQLMLMLEAALVKIERPQFCFEAYRRIGAGLREFVYYIADRDKFLEEFNDHVAGNPHYPIEIKFYEDDTWSDLQDLIDDFKPASDPALEPLAKGFVPVDDVDPALP